MQSKIGTFTFGLFAILVVALSIPRVAAAQSLVDSPPTAAAPPAPVSNGAPTRDSTVLEERPSTGTGKIVVGWIGLGVGVLNLASIPVCFADFYPANAKETCVGASIVLGAAGLGIGIPMLVLGYGQRGRYREWRERNPGAALLDKVRVAGTPGGAMLGLQTTF
jgi:hypothetical protein